MAFEDTNCPCGGKKLRETMLCSVCEAHLANKPEQQIMRDTTVSWGAKRSAAIRLIAMARMRCKRALSTPTTAHREIMGNTVN